MAQIDLIPLPHREAIEYFRSKGYAAPLQRFHHLDHFREEHARDFVVAKAMRDDVLQTIRAELDRALSEGRTLGQFQADLAPRLEKLGWWGKSIERDPLTGELKEVQLGSMRRLRTIFDTNMRTAHAAGHWARIQRTKRAFPYLEYVQIERPTKRHDHARFHGKIWRVDDPIWLRIYPPNGWFCGCTVLQRTEGYMQRTGKTVSDPIDLQEEPWVNKRTGERFMVPEGVDPSFDANPGAAWLDLGDAWDELTPDRAPDQRAYDRGVLEGLRLRRLATGREAIVIADGAGQPQAMRSASAERPSVVDLEGLAVPPSASFYLAQGSETTLQPEALSLLFAQGGSSITAVSPGGSIWRAVRQPGGEVAPLLSEFSTLVPDFAAELRQVQQGGDVLAHARMLWLEMRGAVAYRFRMSNQVRQLMDDNAELIQRLISARR